MPLPLIILLLFESIVWQWISLIAIIIAYVFVVYLVIKTLLQNRNPITTLSWVMVLVLIPFFGIVLYFLFGQRITKRWIFKRLHHKEIQQMGHISNSQLKALQSMETMDDPYLYEFRKLISLLLKNNNSFLSSNNEIEIFHNGYDLYEEIYKELELASQFIHLQYYMFEDGQVAQRIMGILVEKKKAGLDVIMILDGIGSRKFSNESITYLRENGVEVLLFRPVHFPTLTNKMNHRNHRKIIIIDGKVAFTGGINIADKYLNRSDEKGFWRDTHLRITGDSIKMLEAIFIVDHYMVSKEIINDLSKYFPKTEALKGTHIQIATNSPESGYANIHYAFFTAISTAKKTIKLVSPYFIPDETLLMALKNAAMGGIQVEIILPGVKDSAFVQLSARSYVQQLLKDGIKVYFYQRGFIHAKILLIDDLFSMVGSANFDYRSFYHNFEVNTLIYDDKINQDLQKQFEIDKSDSEEIILSKWRKRPRKDKILESLARLMAPLM
jgi:cardiolipin synthase